MKPLRFYADTSVIGGCFDPEFASNSLRSIEAVRREGTVHPARGVLAGVLAEHESGGDRLQHTREMPCMQAGCAIASVSKALAKIERRAH